MEQGNQRKIIGENLRKLRESTNLTQEELAEKLGYSVNSISRIENGKIPMTERFRTEASKFFKVNEAYFFLHDDNQGNEKKERILKEILSQLSVLSSDELEALKTIILTVKTTFNKQRNKS